MIVNLTDLLYLLLYVTFLVGGVVTIIAGLARAATGESACYIEVVGGRMDFPRVLAMAHQRLGAMYAND